MRRARGIVLALVMSLGLLCATGLEGGRRSAHSQSIETEVPVLAAGIELTYFDWRDSGAVTPVRSQGSCAASWAFTATAMLESGIARDTGRQIDLSEQYLLNCGGPAYSCQQGGWGALDLFQSTYLPPQNEAGAVVETVLPYRGVAAACSRAYAHPYRIDRWGYVNLQGASVEQIKQALLDYGPLGAGLCAGQAFGAYRGGVYSRDERGSCLPPGPPTNHTLLITGWNDYANCWLVKNSWGAGWGQGGYGCVAYSVPGIAETAVYLVYREPPGLPVLSTPGSGALVSTLRPALVWRAALGRVDGYQVQVARDPAFTDIALDTRAEGTTFTPAEDLPADALLYWRVRAFRGPLEEILYGKWSTARSLKTLPGMPTPLAPVNTLVITLHPTFTWSGSAGQLYDLQISRSATCATVLRAALVTGPAYQPPVILPGGDALYWRVRARGSNGPSPWSECVRFWVR